MLTDTSTLNREALADQYRENRRRTRALFDVLRPEAYYARPIALRHPIVFYEGHLPAFSLNTLVKKALGRPGVDAHLERLFARGIDPDSEVAADGSQPALWPSRDDVQRFADACDALVLEALANAPIEQPGHPLLHETQAVFAILEHEAMHQETLLYLWHQLPDEHKRAPAGWAPAPGGTTPRAERVAIAVSLVVAGAGLLAAASTGTGSDAGAGAPGLPYGAMPELAPIGVRVDRYLDVAESAKGPAVDAAKGYRTEKIGDGLYMLTDGAYQSMFMTYESGVVVVDAPPPYAARIRQAIAEVSDKPITHLVYSHYHSDHIGGPRTLGGTPIIIAHRETNRLLARDADPNRPLAAVTFDDRHRLEVGSQVLELSYHGVAHAPGNIFIHAPKQRALMVVDVIFPGWMPWRRFALAQYVPGYFAQVETISRWSFDTLVGGHVGRTGTPADVATQRAFMQDLKAAAETALKTTVPAEGLAAADLGNPWAVFDHYIDRVAVSCVNQLTPKWSRRLAAYDVYIWDQCYSMEQSLRID